ncbi:hypothetical protein [Streptomyces sp. NPDC004014]
MTSSKTGTASVHRLVPEVHRRHPATPHSRLCRKKCALRQIEGHGFEVGPTLPAWGLMPVEQQLLDGTATVVSVGSRYAAQVLR